MLRLAAFSARPWGRGIPSQNHKILAVASRLQQHQQLPCEIPLRCLYKNASGNNDKGLNCISDEYGENIGGFTYNTEGILVRLMAGISTMCLTNNTITAPKGRSLWPVKKNGDEHRRFFSKTTKKSKKPDSKTTAKGSRAACYENDEIRKLVEQKSFQQIQKTLEDMLHSDAEERLELDMFYDILSECVESKLENKGEMAETFLSIMIKFYKTKRLDRAPTQAVVSQSFIAWAKSRHPEAGKRAEEVLDQIQKMSLAGTLPFSLDVRDYSNVMKAYANQGDAQNAERILHRMIEDVNAGNAGAAPNEYTIGTLLDAHARSQSKQKGERAEEILNHSIELYGITPNSYCYSNTINAYAKVGNAQKAEEVLEQMYADFQGGNRDARPDIYSFNSVLDALARSPSQTAGQRAEKILDRMAKLHHDQVLQVRPNAVSYNAVMNAYAKHGRVKDAERVLERMDADYQNGNSSAKPDIRSFNSVLNAWANSGETDAGRNAEMILEHMKKLHSDSKFDVNPEVVAYSSVINAYAKTGQAKDAERILETMYSDYQNGNKRAKPGIKSFNTVLDAWARSGDTKAGERAEAILGHMRVLKDSKDMGDIIPTDYSYNTVINTWAELGNARRAIHIFEQMVQDYQNGNTGAKPVIVSFGTLLKAFVKAGLGDAGTKADTLLSYMERFGLEPDISILINNFRCWEIDNDRTKAKLRMKEIQCHIDTLRAGETK